MAIVATLHLRDGADLVAEPFATALAARLAQRASDDDAIDGALELVADAGEALCRPDFWDRVDGLLLAWIDAAEALAGGADEATLTFPDTRIEAELSIVDRGDGGDDSQVAIRYEDVDAVVPLAALRASLDGAAARLLDATGPCTTALRALAGRPRIAEIAGAPGSAATGEEQ
jgi:hypothetical protein